MIPDDVEALALADSIGALDADDRDELEARLADLTPEERKEVAQLYDTALAIASSVEQVSPPSHLRDRVLKAARTPTSYTVWNSDDDWVATPLAGIRMKVLAVDKTRSLATLLIRAEAGAVYPPHRHHGPEECYVISGSVIIAGRVLRAGDFHHADDQFEHAEITTTEGAEVLIVGAIEDYLPA
jgi:anti-sigma factor ChrR (cupin superfamily)